MKNLIFIVLLVISFLSVKAQNIIVEYEVKTLYSGTKGKEFAIITPIDSYYFDYVEEDNAPIKEIIENYNIKRGGQKMYRKLLDYNNIYRIKAYPGQYGEQSLIIDNKQEINWEIFNENKLILNMLCQKAVGKFRGRTYTVWFTKEIPVSLGPWKIDGLPGLILEAKDNSNVNSYNAVQVIHNTDLGIPQNILSFIENYPQQNMKSYKDYIFKEDIALKERQQKALSNLPKGTNIVDVPNVRDLQREISFEWEDTKKP
ncbi:GLPGLI family protein [Chryseobacterium gotjawalense]|uniref:GLPGLI family protein n=1 Tax=Chryseobacterium gotjawalense TaxID=3042315 RepID=A0ABY8RGQ7_9FLAO|nr:GLPGLI family protein [Chryseobacterium sp. wdc7]WHF52207.1 GLPGLI family protein [Chryseobacterium sp. wdc7]